MIGEEDSRLGPSRLLAVKVEEGITTGFGEKVLVAGMGSDRMPVEGNERLCGALSVAPASICWGGGCSANAREYLSRGIRLETYLS